MTDQKEKMMTEKIRLANKLDIQPPFLMIDHFQIAEPGRRATATKKLSSDEWFFQCHLPKSPVMPATLQIEGMLQTLVLLLYESYEHGEKRAFINDIKVKVLATALPDTELEFEATLLSMRRGISKGEVTGKTNGKLICRGEFCYASPHLMSLPPTK